ncbi:endoplasmic reticulum mannosyl-oligosaccharide 1,2-alpha-mannosidase [Xylariaceae sp. FL1019]|nr:endoplasmic reticulum mannosyl-oligosaccharide 1,2-alpha-mannosidase [Xylariaceae sp. FL1019]
MYRQLSQHRNTLILLVGLLVLVWTLTARFRGDAVTEFKALERHMNDDFEPLIPSRASFDWSQVPARGLTGEITPLPKRSWLSRKLPSIQAKFATGDPSYEKLREWRRHEVKKVFVSDWEAYKRYAWLKDALMPISGSYRDQFSGWAATLVDSLDTLWIMGLRHTFDEAVDAASKIDFGESSSHHVNTFETNIRYLGGLLAAYDLSKRETLLQKATELGNLLYVAFNTNNRLPVDFINVPRAKEGARLVLERTVVSASPGTLSLELTRLSQLTGDPKYYSAIDNIMNLFHEGQNKTVLPGLWPMMVSMNDANVIGGNQFTLAGCADSLYEYLPKMHALLGGTELKYEEMSVSFLEAAKKLLFRPMIPGNERILMASSAWVENDGEIKLDQETEHLGCYLGGVYALAGRLHDNKEYINIGAKLTSGCVYAYRSFPTGMMPERLNMVACKSFEDCEWDADVFEQEKKKQKEAKDHLPPGFTTAKDPRYLLRPEAIESVFIMYRITGNPIWQELGWEMFEAIVKGTRTPLGTHASVSDVTRATRILPKEDYMESFWLAETLKYFYLLFCPPDIISLDDYVLNTEAHPFLRTK